MKENLGRHPFENPQNQVYWNSIVSSFKFDKPPRIPDISEIDFDAIEQELARDGFVVIENKRRNLLIPAGAALGLLSFAAGCNPTESQPPPPPDQATVVNLNPTIAATPRPTEQTFPIVNVNQKGEFLNFPFPRNLDIKIQQAWSSDFEPNHHAMDYIYGEIDRSSTWKNFPVLASASGLICANPPDRLGNAAFEQLRLSDGRTAFIYYGHLSKIENGIPECSTGERKTVLSGEQIGISGDTGTNPGWIHLHFSVNINGAKDPYGLESADIKAYPDPNFKNGKTCKEVHLFIGCPIETTGIAMQLRYADGKPIFNQTAYIFSIVKDIDGNPKPDKEVARISTGEIGLLKTDLSAGEFIILFPTDGKVKGQKLTEKDSHPGIKGVKVEQGKTNTQKLVLGRVTFEIKDKDGKPSGNASACLEAKDINGKEYDVSCENADDKTGIIEIDSLPGKGYNAKVQIGKTNVIPLFGFPGQTPLFPVSVEEGKIDKVSCAIDFDKQSGSCTH